MQTINDHLPTTNNLKQSGKPRQFEPTSRNVAIVTRLWEKMAQIFAAKWFTQYGQMMEEGSYTEAFMLWCEETAQLTDEQWVEGFAAVERRIVADIAHNRDSWPPTAPIFKAMCKPVSTTSGASAESFKRHPNLIASEKQAQRIAVDPNYKERTNKTGNETLSRLKDLL